MKLYQLRKIKQLLYVVIGLMAIILIRLFTLPTTYQKPNVESSIVVETDTIWTTQVDTLRMNTNAYKTVYVTKTDTVFKPSRFVTYPVRLYQDTLVSKDVTVYSKQYINGELVNGTLSYTLHIPKIIKTVKVKEVSTIVKNNLYAYGEVGGRLPQISNTSIGLLYTHQSKWMLSYRMGLAPIYKPTHHIGVGYRLL